MTDAIKNFDPNGIGLENGQLFGMPFNFETASVIILPVCWDVTVSYAAGTAKGPNAILKASPQLDFYDENLGEAWKNGIYMFPIDKQQGKWAKKLRKDAKEYIDWLTKGKNSDLATNMQEKLERINSSCSLLMESVFNQVLEILNANKIPAILGGDHSTPLGLIKALGTKYKEIGILQIDAHMDLRQAYEDFVYSHASIMYNAVQENHVVKLVQVGIRDISAIEASFIEENSNKITVFTDKTIKNSKFTGQSWSVICDTIVAHLPPKVYISFDIDGLDPSLCPHTGTPVPGGLSFSEAVYLIQKVVQSGREIVGFDLVEVAPGSEGDWDANVGARILYQLAIWAAESSKNKQTNNINE